MKTWDEFQHASTAQVLEWAENEPWARDMAACRQDAQWHAEGDVWTHTKMVAGELERLAEWGGLDSDLQLKLLFAALFHDAGKPATTATVPSTGRIHSPKHAVAGVEIARRVLRELGCPLEIREGIAGLVRYHGRPPYLLEKADPAHELISLSWLVNHRLLYLFALADTRGRHSHETKCPEENLQLWKLVAEENGCFERPYAFANDQARFLFYRGALSSLHYTPREEYSCTVTLMAGLPGSGKDSWLAHQRPGLPVVSLDDLRAQHDVDPSDDQGEIAQLASESCREHLRAGREFAFNATNILRQTRRRWIDLFADYRARIDIVYLEPPLATIFAQNERRTNRVPEKAMHRLVEKLEPPTVTEGHSLRLVV
jgi:putative nucleotidyltransferase with HDIG domain